MPVLGTEHTMRECAADCAVQIAAIVLLIGLLARDTLHGQLLSLVALVLTGLFVWTFIEYCVHRFILHGLRPWSSWHTQHHGHPLSHIFAPTLYIATLFAALIFVPVLWLGGLWIACGLTLGILGGHLLYSLTHLAIHHCTARGPWLRQRQLWHIEHHRQGESKGCQYGVTMEFWDHLFAAAGRLGRERTAR